MDTGAFANTVIFPAVGFVFWLYVFFLWMFLCVLLTWVLVSVTVISSVIFVSCVTIVLGLFSVQIFSNVFEKREHLKILLNWNTSFVYLNVLF